MLELGATGSGLAKKSHPIAVSSLNFSLAGKRLLTGKANNTEMYLYTPEAHFPGKEVG